MGKRHHWERWGREDPEHFRDCLDAYDIDILSMEASSITPEIWERLRSHPEPVVREVILRTRERLYAYQLRVKQGIEDMQRRILDDQERWERSQAELPAEARST